MNHVEQALTVNLEKLYQRIDLLSNEMTLIALKRLPPWITIIISVLSAAVVGLIVAAVK
jgi:ABC-type enterochelin transport system permease subunit